MTPKTPELAKIYAPLDPGIKDVVEFLRKLDINTTGSCDGKHNGQNECPWVTIQQKEAEHLGGVHQEILAALLMAGYHGFTIEEHFLYQRINNPWKAFLRVTFWGEAKPE